MDEKSLRALMGQFYWKVIMDTTGEIDVSQKNRNGEKYEESDGFQ